jgi:hypothetical protein
MPELFNTQKAKRSQSPLFVIGMNDWHMLAH